jgi:xanthine dehydrogenase accessory factor
MFDEVASALRRGESLALLTVVRVSGAAPCPPGSKLIVRQDGRIVGSLGGMGTDARASEDALRILRSGQAELVTYHLDPDSGESVGSCGATLEIFIEPARPELRLLIAGSGYVAQALARLAGPLGWRVAVVDDRSEFTRSTGLPPNVEIAVSDIAAWLIERTPDPMTAIVIVTRGHRADEEALRAALITSAGYIGMIGSPSKVRAIFRRLLRAGVSQADLERVHAPIGLDLAAETPDEIALSIAAELLQWRRGGTGQPLCKVAGVLAQVLGSTGKESADEDTTSEEDGQLTPPEEVPAEISAP